MAAPATRFSRLVGILKEEDARQLQSVTDSVYEHLKKVNPDTTVSLSVSPVSNGNCTVEVSVTRPEETRINESHSANLAPRPSQSATSALLSRLQRLLKASEKSNLDIYAHKLSLANGSEYQITEQSLINHENVKYNSSHNRMQHLPRMEIDSAAEACTVVKISLQMGQRSETSPRPDVSHRRMAMHPVHGFLESFLSASGPDFEKVPYVVNGRTFPSDGSFQKVPVEFSAEPVETTLGKRGIRDDHVCAIQIKRMPFVSTEDCQDLSELFVNVHCTVCHSDESAEDEQWPCDHARAIIHEYADFRSRAKLVAMSDTAAKEVRFSSDLEAEGSAATPIGDLANSDPDLAHEFSTFVQLLGMTAQTTDPRSTPCSASLEDQLDDMIKSNLDCIRSWDGSDATEIQKSVSEFCKRASRLRNTIGAYNNSCRPLDGTLRPNNKYLKMLPKVVPENVDIETIVSESGPSSLGGVAPVRSLKVDLPTSIPCVGNFYPIEEADLPVVTDILLAACRFQDKPGLDKTGLTTVPFQFIRCVKMVEHVVAASLERGGNKTCIDDLVDRPANRLNFSDPLISFMTSCQKAVKREDDTVVQKGFVLGPFSISTPRPDPDIVRMNVKVQKDVAFSLLLDTVRKTLAFMSKSLLNKSLEAEEKVKMVSADKSCEVSITLRKETVDFIQTQYGAWRKGINVSASVRSCLTRKDEVNEDLKKAFDKFDDLIGRLTSEFAIKKKSLGVNNLYSVRKRDASEPIVHFEGADEAGSGVATLVAPFRVHKSDSHGDRQFHLIKGGQLLDEESQDYLSSASNEERADWFAREASREMSGQMHNLLNAVKSCYPVSEGQTATSFFKRAAADFSSTMVRLSGLGQDDSLAVFRNSCGHYLVSIGQGSLRKNFVVIPEPLCQQDYMPCMMDKSYETKFVEGKATHEGKRLNYLVSKCFSTDDAYCSNAILAGLRVESVGLYAQGTSFCDTITSVTYLGQFSRAATDAGDILYNAMKNGQSAMSEMLDDVEASVSEIRYCQSAYFISVFSSIILYWMRKKCNDLVKDPRHATEGLFALGANTFTIVMPLAILFTVSDKVSVNALLNRDVWEDRVVQIGEQELNIMCSVGTVVGGKNRPKTMLDRGTLRKHAKEHLTRFVRDAGNSLSKTLVKQSWSRVGRTTPNPLVEMQASIRGVPLPVVNDALIGLTESLVCSCFNHARSDRLQRFLDVISPIKVSANAEKKGWEARMSQHASEMLKEGSILAGPTSKIAEIGSGSGARYSFVLDILSNWSIKMNERKARGQDAIPLRVAHLAYMVKCWLKVFPTRKSAKAWVFDNHTVMFPCLCGGTDSGCCTGQKNDNFDGLCPAFLFESLHPAEAKRLGYFMNEDNWSNVHKRDRAMAGFVVQLDGLFRPTSYGSSKVQRVGYRLIFTMTLGGLFDNLDYIIQKGMESESGMPENELVSAGMKAVNNINYCIEQVRTGQLPTRYGRYVQKISEQVASPRNCIVQLLMTTRAVLLSYGVDPDDIQAIKDVPLPQNHCVSRADHSAFSPADQPSKLSRVFEQPSKLTKDQFKSAAERVILGNADYSPIIPTSWEMESFGEQMNKGRLPTLVMLEQWCQGYMTVPSSLDVLNATCAQQRLLNCLGVFFAVMQNSDDQCIYASRGRMTQVDPKLAHVSREVFGPNSASLTHRILLMAPFCFAQNLTGRVASAKKGGIGGGVIEIIFRLGIVGANGKTNVTVPPPLSSTSGVLKSGPGPSSEIANRFEVAYENAYNDTLQPRPVRQFESAVRIFLDTLGHRELFLHHLAFIEPAAKHLKQELGWQISDRELLKLLRTVLPTRLGGFFCYHNLSTDTEVADVMYSRYDLDVKSSLMGYPDMTASQKEIAQSMVRRLVAPYLTKLRDYQIPSDLIASTRDIETTKTIESIVRVPARNAHLPWATAGMRSNETVINRLAVKCRQQTHSKMSLIGMVASRLFREQTSSQNDDPDELASGFPLGDVSRNMINRANLRACELNNFVFRSMDIENQETAATRVGPVKPKTKIMTRNLKSVTWEFEKRLVDLLSNMLVYLHTGIGAAYRDSPGSGMRDIISQIRWGVMQLIESLNRGCFPKERADRLSIIAMNAEAYLTVFEPKMVLAVQSPEEDIDPTRSGMVIRPMTSQEANEFRFGMLLGLTVARFKQSNLGRGHPESYYLGAQDLRVCYEGNGAFSTKAAVYLRHMCIQMTRTNEPGVFQPPAPGETDIRTVDSDVISKSGSRKSNVDIVELRYYANIVADKNTKHSTILTAIHYCLASSDWNFSAVASTTGSLDVQEGREAKKVKTNDSILTLRDYKVASGLSNLPEHGSFAGVISSLCMTTDNDIVLALQTVSKSDTALTKAALNKKMVSSNNGRLVYRDQLELLVVRIRCMKVREVVRSAIAAGQEIDIPCDIPNNLGIRHWYVVGHVESNAEPHRATGSLKALLTSPDSVRSSLRMMGEAAPHYVHGLETSRGLGIRTDTQLALVKVSSSSKAEALVISQSGPKLEELYRKSKKGQAQTTTAAPPAGASPLQAFAAEFHAMHGMSWADF